MDGHGDAERGGGTQSAGMSRPGGAGGERAIGGSFHKLYKSNQCVIYVKLIIKSHFFKAMAYQESHFRMTPRLSQALIFMGSCIKGAYLEFSHEDVPTQTTLPSCTCAAKQRPPRFFFKIVSEAVFVPCRAVEKFFSLQFCFSQALL